MAMPEAEKVVRTFHLTFHQERTEKGATSSFFDCCLCLPDAINVKKAGP
jgi:hypothetical protein